MKNSLLNFLVTISLFLFATSTAYALDLVAPLKHCISFYENDLIECDLDTDKKINSSDFVKWYSVSRSSPDPRFGTTLAVTEFSTDVLPSTGQPLFNKTHQYQIIDAGFAPENDFTWARNELNAGNKTQFIHTSWAYYQPKSLTNDVYLGPNGRTPEWLSTDDLAEFAAAGFSSWQSLPDNYPVWRHGLTRFVQGVGYQKNGFAAGNMIFNGWRDIGGNCITPGNSGNFNVYLQSAPRDSVTNLISPVVQNNRRVPKGSYGDVLPALSGEWIQPCNAQVYQEQQFKDFITRNPGNTYFIYNEMDMGFMVGQDVMSPQLYAPHYAYYLNLMKGFNYGANCTQVALDPNAKVLIGIAGQSATWANDRSKIWGDWKKWYQDFVTEWRRLSEQPKCTIPGRPFSTIPKTVNGTTYQTIPTDGIPYYEYEGYPNASTSTLRNGTCTEATEVLDRLKNLILTDANVIRNDFNSSFSNAIPYLKEYGISNTVLSTSSPDFQSELYSYWKNYLNKCTSSDCYAQYKNEMAKYAKQDLYVVSQVTKWLKDIAFSSYQIQRAAWLPTWHDLAWKKINGQGLAPLTRMQNPGTTLGQQLFAPSDAPVPFISPQLTGVYTAIRGQAFGCAD